MKFNILSRSGESKKIQAKDKKKGTLVENGIINVSKYSVCELVFSMVFI